MAETNSIIAVHKDYTGKIVSIMTDEHEVLTMDEAMFYVDLGRFPGYITTSAMGTPCIRSTPNMSVEDNLTNKPEF